MRHGYYARLTLLVLAAWSAAALAEAVPPTTVSSRDSIETASTAPTALQAIATATDSQPTPPETVNAYTEAREPDYEPTNIDTPALSSPGTTSVETPSASSTASSTTDKLATVSAAANKSEGAAPEASATAAPTESSSTTVVPPSPAVAAPFVEELPLVEIPPAPELPSFQEWRDRYVVQLDSAGARRSRKAAQRVRQDTVGAGALGAGGAMYDGDGADFGSLFVIGEDPPMARAGAEGTALSGSVGTAPAHGGGSTGGAAGTRSHVDRAEPYPPHVESATSDLASPLLPVPNVGTGDESDPLVHLKDRSNYAAFECAAMVHRSSRQSKGASSILVEKKDRYMLTPCAAQPKFVDVELCDEIQIDTIVLANFEFFSSTFKHFKASCSVDYPGKPADWHDLGTYRANNARGVQVFRPMRNPHFCRYLRIDFLSHYGSEYYCPVSLLRVYGFTQLDAYRESERKAKAIEEALAAADLIEEEQQDESDLEALVWTEVAPPAETFVGRTQEPINGGAIDDSAESVADVESTAEPAPAREMLASGASQATIPTQPSVTAVSTAAEPSQPSIGSDASGPPSVTSAGTSVLGPPAPRETDAAVADPTVAVPTSSDARNATESVASQVPNVTTTSEATATAPAGAVQGSATVASGPATNATATAGDRAGPSPSAAPNTSTEGAVAHSTLESQSAAATSANASATQAGKPPVETVISVTPQQQHQPTQTPSAPLPQPPLPPPRPPILQQPQPGESIYGTIMKRLTSLEHNQTIAMHFIEAQSTMLREAFGRVERRLHDIEVSKIRQEQHIRQALLDLETRRLEMDRERLALTTQVGVLAQEVRFGKRLTIAQLVGILALVVFVGFTRGLPTSPFLHLASTRGEGRSIGWRRARSDRGSSVDDSPKPEEAAVLPPASVHRKTHRTSPSTSLSRGGESSMKRKLSLSKPVPRRHYAVTSAYSGGGRNGLLRALDLSKGSAAGSRPRTPPVRHSSAPPEEPPEGLASALAAREALRRRGASSRPAGSTYRFPAAPGREGPAVPGQEGRVTSPLGLGTLPLPRLRPTASFADASRADEADTEREVLLAASEITSPTTSSTNGFVQSSEDDGGYHTYSSSDELSPGRNRLLSPPRSTERLRQSPSPPSASPRPPRHQVQVRPATSMGFIRDEGPPDGSPSRRQRIATHGDNVEHPKRLSPMEGTPEPPPEAVESKVQVDPLL